VLEDANVKLGDVLSDVFCVSGRLMLQALLDGELSPDQIAELAKKKARVKIPQIAASIADHRLTDHQPFLTQCLWTAAETGAAVGATVHRGSFGHEAGLDLIHVLRRRS